MQSNIRNFCIIAHIDHGKSTLCDRMMEFTQTLSKRELKEQTLDQMDLEQERGITIKLQPVRMDFEYKNTKWMLNLIDTPGHVDFHYEVSRSLAAVEGAILLVDATQGIQAQTLANLYLAMEQELTIIPVINKIDLPNANVLETQNAIQELIGGKKEDILKVSAKTGEGVLGVLKTVVNKVPAPLGDEAKNAQALIFDSFYDSYKGVVAYVRMVEGTFKDRDEVFMKGAAREAEILELGVFRPALIKQPELKAGQIGYIATGLKDVGECRVGDTIVENSKKAVTQPLAGYKKIKPIVFASFYPRDGEKYNQLRDALEKLSLNDASFEFYPESSKALGRGFRGGFLGLLHLEIMQERLKREFDMDLVFTVPSVEFKIKLRNTRGFDPKDLDQDNLLTINSPQDLPEPSKIESILEPFVRLEVITTSPFMGALMELLSKKRSIYKSTSYLDQNRLILTYELPLQEIITNLHDEIKSASKGYASINYEFLNFRENDLVKLDILVAEELKEEFSRIIPKENAPRIARNILKKLKDSLPKQSFMVKLQAAINGKIIA
ncbi:MAG: elongation factor 4, partial [Candidatus Moranbacteria bacterium]|nr:elongation factor 4 [Candidatus Moranbacteria bacterium]